MQSLHPHFDPRRLLAFAILITTFGFALAAQQPQTPSASSNPSEDQTPQSSATTSSALAPTAIPAFRQADHIAVITVKGPIDRITLRSLERRIGQAGQDGATAIVLDIDTPGGELTAALDICNLLKDHSITPANSVAWVHPQAYSAGTIIGLACREIVVSPNATFGDAAPIMVMPGAGLIQMQPAERAKTEAPLLAEVVDSARRNHYDENLVQSFISVGIELWLIENLQSGERIFVNRSEYRTVFGEEPPDELIPTAPPQPEARALPVRPWVKDIFQIPDEAQSETPSEAQKAKELEFAQLLPPVRQPLSEADRDQWKLITQVVTDDRLLTIKPAEAIHYGLARKVIANDGDLKKFFGATTLTRYDRSWSEGLVRFLIHPALRVVLIVIFLVCLFIELAAPGLGVFGATALLSLLLIIGAPYLAGMAQWWDILLIVIGIALVGTELFLIPGFGVIGIIGAVCLLAGMVGTFVSGDLNTVHGQDQLVKGLLMTLLAFFLGAGGIWLVSRQLHSIPVLNRVILKTELGQTPTGGIGMLEAMGTSTGKALEPGDVGLAETDLRPAGRASFNNRIIDVKSISEFIVKGTPLRVVSVGRFVIEVEESVS